MTPERYKQLLTDDDAYLTSDEMDEGWHFCSCNQRDLMGPPKDLNVRHACCTWMRKWIKVRVDDNDSGPSGTPGDVEDGA